MKGRRAFLGGLAGSAAALPFLRGLPVSAGGASPPKVVFVGAPQGPLVGPSGGSIAGISYDGWRPAGLVDGDNPLPATLPHVFKPLEPHVDRLHVLEGLRGLPDQGGGHLQVPSLLTGRTYVGEPGGEQIILSVGQSVDHYIAEQVGSRVLTTAARPQYYVQDESYWSYSAPQQPDTGILDPVTAYSQVFGDGLDVAAAQRLLARRESVLDVVAGDLTTMRASLPAADRERLNAHLEAVRALEQDLAEAAGAQCQAPGVPDEYDPRAFANFPRAARDHTETIVQALACGWTQVASLQLGNFGGNFKPAWPEYGVDSPNYTCHAIAHAFVGTDGAGSQGLSATDAVPWHLAIERTYSTMVANLLQRLTDTLDENGQPLIETTLVLYARPMSYNHTVVHWVWMVAGGPSVGVTGGRWHLTSGQENQRYVNDVLAGVCQSMGLPDEQYGDPQYCTQPFSFA